MMHVKHYSYSACNVDVVSLDPSDEIAWLAETTASSYGTYYYSGGNTIIEGLNTGAVVSGPNGWYPNIWTGFMRVRASDQGAMWICVSQNNDVRREAKYQEVQDTFTLAAGWGFVVIDGSLQADGKTATRANYFKPRDFDVEVQGSGTLLLVR